MKTMIKGALMAVMLGALAPLTPNTSLTTLPSLMQQMYDDGIQSLLVEGGAITHRSFMEAGLWDEIREEVSPCILGDGTAAPALPEDSVVRRQMTVGTHTITQYVNPNLDLG